MVNQAGWPTRAGTPKWKGTDNVDSGETSCRRIVRPCLLIGAVCGVVGLGSTSAASASIEVAGPGSTYSAPAMVSDSTAGFGSNWIVAGQPYGNTTAADFYWGDGGTDAMVDAFTIGPDLYTPAIVHTPYDGTGLTSIGYEGRGHTLDMEWNWDGVSHFGDAQQIAPGGSLYARPAMAFNADFPNPFEFVAEGRRNDLVYYHPCCGADWIWSPQLIAPGVPTGGNPQSGSAYSAPAMIDNRGYVQVAVEGPNHTLAFWYKPDNSTKWTMQRVAGKNSTYSPPVIVDNTAGNIEVAAMGPTNSLDYYWQTHGTTTWKGGRIKAPRTTYSTPAIVYNSNDNNTEIAVEGPENSLQFYWNHDGSPTWDTAGPSGVIGLDTTYSAPAMTRYDDGTAIAFRGYDNQLFMTNNDDGSPIWH